MDNNLMLYKEILDNLYEGVYFVDTHRRIIYWNKEAERITGFKSEEIVGKHCYDNILNHVDDNNNQLCKNGCPLHKTIKDGLHRETGVYLHHKNGHRVSVALRTIPLYSDGKIIGAVEVFVDDNKQAETNKMIEHLQNLALYDQLTELPNRRYIDSFISNRLKEYQDLKIPFGVAMMDIDHFKKVNDTYGHDIGDDILCMISKTFRSSFRKSDLVGRWGGEEFLAVLPAVTDDEINSVLQKTKNLVQKSSLRTEKEPISVTISIGATLVGDKDTAASIQKRADKALYHSKENGRNRVTVL